jgi:hypothetical protein
MDYYSGILYCSLLSIDGTNDWRMISRDEFYDKEMVYDGFWFIEDGEICGDGFYNALHYYVIPVRDY